MTNSDPDSLLHTSQQTPAELGYSMPPEWHHHAATLLIWPSNRETWPGERLDRVEKVYLSIIEALTPYEPVVLLIRDDSIKKRVLTLFRENGLADRSVKIIQHPVNDVWARDCGPIMLRKKTKGGPRYVISDWDYNAWGEKYPPFDGDNAIPEMLAKKFKLQRFVPGMVLEGGSIEVNSRGELLTTESVLLNPNRNPGLSKTQIENRLKEYLGITKIIWLKNGMKGDDTDGHIDDLSRFVNDDTIVTMLPERKNDVNYKSLKQNYDILNKARNHRGRGYEIIPIPTPNTKIEGTTVDGSENVPASYANFYIANGCVLLPLYDPRYDEEVLSLFTDLFPDKKIIGVPCADLVWGQGSIHCITQQLYGPML